MTQKRDYMKPTMNVVEVRTESHLLAGSSGGAGVQNYNWNDYEEE